MENEIIKLSPSHKRYLKASLLTFEKSIRKSKRLLEEKEAQGFLFKRSNTLEPGQRIQIEKKLNEALQKLHLVIKKIGLKPREEKSEQIIIAEMSMSWANLIECRSDHLKGYGEIDREYAMILDPEIESLVDISHVIIKQVTEYVKEKKNDEK